MYNGNNLWTSGYWMVKHNLQEHNFAFI